MQNSTKINEVDKENIVIKNSFKYREMDLIKKKFKTSTTKNLYNN